MFWVEDVDEDGAGLTEVGTEFCDDLCGERVVLECGFSDVFACDVFDGVVVEE